ncbi:MAG: ribosome-associated translation inhibitor RaiA [Actinomycetota bacterium]|jgi:putative sigma-54 modulation protein|nr:ribosome-associated translation inhibitor RaiA [Actinomycetota bacterium]
MEFTIRSRHMEVPDALRTAAQEKVTRLTRHLDGWDTAEVHFLEERNPRISEKEVCEVTLRGHGHVVRAKAASADPFTAVDRVVDKLAHQVERLKTRQSRKAAHKRPPIESVLPPAHEGEEEEDEVGTGRIVKVKRFDLKPMTPEEAALQMDLLGHSFYFFNNAESGMPAVVYRRNDGDVGLIDAS